MQARREAQAFRPDEIKLLQECYDTIVARRFLDSRSERGGEIASALILAFRRGVRGRDELIGLADLPNQSTEGADI
ncbi:hypothetical protein [Mesorhizobium sp. CN2-181]|uniref:hypothetical protein n=1 Tax=Mesorhizobium yinganensis TaxID=3157707 RepID=UPI0032B6FFF2